MLNCVTMFPLEMPIEYFESPARVKAGKRRHLEESEQQRKHIATIIMLSVHKYHR